jgi:hypothetical protein
MSLFRPVVLSDAAQIQSLAFKDNSGEIIAEEKEFVADLQSAANKNQNLAEGEQAITVKDVLDKHCLTKEDAAEFQSRAMREIGCIPADSIISDIQSYADRYGGEGDRSKFGPATVTKELAAHVQSVSAQAYGGEIPKGSKPAKMQSMADKNVHDRT